MIILLHKVTTKWSTKSSVWYFSEIPYLVNNGSLELQLEL